MLLVPSSSSPPPTLVIRESNRHLPTQTGLSLYLRTRPNTQFQNLLEFFCHVIPSIVVAQSVRGQVVVCVVSPTDAMGKHMVSLPTIALLDPSSANVASRTRLRQHALSLGFCQAMAFRPFLLCLLLLFSSLIPQPFQIFGISFRLNWYVAKSHIRPPRSFRAVQRYALHLRGNDRARLRRRPYRGK